MFKAKIGSPDRHLESALSKAEEQKLCPCMDLTSALRDITFFFLRFTLTLSATSHISHQRLACQKIGIGILTSKYIPDLKSISEWSIDANKLCVKLL
jgi:hypothetical protein